MTPWDIPTLTERTLALYREGKSNSEIAGVISKEFGVHMTRNAVVGKCHRMGWVRPGAAASLMTTRQIGQTKQERLDGHEKVLRKDVRKKPTPFTFKPVILAPADTPAPVPYNPKAWEPFEGMEAVREVPGFGYCRWPIGEPGSSDFGYCGAPAQVNRKGKVSPYCCGHYARAYYASTPPRLSLKSLIGARL